MSQFTYLDLGAGAVSQYNDWLEDALHGDALIYWTGDLQYDRQLGDLKTQILDTLASRIVRDAKDGILVLTQKRIAENVFEYRAHRIRPERNPEITIGRRIAIV